MGGAWVEQVRRPVLANVCPLYCYCTSSTQYPGRRASTTTIFLALAVAKESSRTQCSNFTGTPHSCPNSPCIAVHFLVLVHSSLVGALHGVLVGPLVVSLSYVTIIFKTSRVVTLAGKHLLRPENTWIKSTFKINTCSKLTESSCSLLFRRFSFFSLSLPLLPLRLHPLGNGLGLFLVEPS